MALPLTLLIIMGCIDFSMCTILTCPLLSAAWLLMRQPVLGLTVTLAIVRLRAFNGFIVATELAAYLNPLPCISIKASPVGSA